MRSALPLALCAVTGCDLAFGLGDRVAPDAALDAPVDDAIPCTQMSGTVVAIADSMLIHDNTGECNPANRFGAFTSATLGLNAGQGTRSRLVLRFSLTDHMITTLTPSGGFVAGTLRLPLEPDACAAPCPSTGLGFSIYPVRNQWNEGSDAPRDGAGWCMRQQSGAAGTPWGVPGADGAEDRGTVSLADISLADAQVQGDSVSVALSTVDGVMPWLDGRQVSLLLVPTAPGTLFTRTHEDSLGGGAELTITSCR